MSYRSMDAEARPYTGSMTLLAAIAFALVAVVLINFAAPPEVAALVLIACFGVLIAVGVACLFAAAAGLLKPYWVRQRVAADGWAREFFESIGEGALVTDRTGIPVAANDAYLKLTGEEDGAEPKAIERLCPSDPDVSQAVYRLANMAAKGRRSVEEVRIAGGITGRAGQPRWYRIRVCPLGSRGELVCWLVADVTREREKQENIFQELQNAIDYLDHAPAGFFSAQPDGSIRYINATLAGWLGIDLADFEPGKARIADFLPPEALPLLEAARKQGGADQPEAIDVDLVGAGGKRLPARLLHDVPVTSEGLAGASRTLVLRSDPQADSDAAHLARARFSRFFNHTPIAIAAIDISGRLGLSNARFNTLFFAKDGRQRPILLSDVVDPADREAVQSVVSAAIAGSGAVPPVEATFAGDPKRSGRFYVSPVLDANGGAEAAIAYVVETTEQRALGERLARAEKMSAVGQLAGGIAHDFNNVLQGIIGFTDLLLKSHAPTDPSFGDIMQIKQSSNRATDLVRQLLAFSRQQTLRPQVIDLGEALADVAHLLNRLIGERIALTLVNEPGLWRIKADRAQLEQVIINLTVNARDAMPKGGTLAISTENVPASAMAQRRDMDAPAVDHVMISVADTGTGIDPQNLERIFEPFFSTKEVGKGTGLGLSTVYGIIAQTGGLIAVDSTLGKGTVFRVFLPRHHVEAGEATAPVREEAKPQMDLTAPRRRNGVPTILLVEDDLTARIPVARTLAEQGYVVHEAASGLDALDLLERLDAPIDLVITDVIMPGLDGPGLIDEIRASHPDVKVIFISGYAEEEFASRLADMPSFRFIAKPFSLKDLVVAVRRAIDGDERLIGAAAATPPRVDA